MMSFRCALAHRHSPFRFMLLTGFLLLVNSVLTVPASAASSSAGAIVAAPAAPKLAPLRPFYTDKPPIIDGVLDDDVWKQAPSETGFKTWFPDFGKDMREKTVVYYAYDHENLYFAFRAFDSQPGKVKASVTARDQIFKDDWICINLDSFNDQQSLYCFYVNPLGIQGDSRFEGGQEDFSVDVIWYSAGRIDAEGFTIEMRVPFKSLRYRRREPVEMGIIFERRVSRMPEGGTYPPLDPVHGQNFLTQTRPLAFAGIRHFTLFELLPAATYSKRSEINEGTLDSLKGRGDLSLTAKYGLTSQLILDGTINPDFSQVESDAGQVDFNLRYALYYPEKRPFFLEGREKFALGAAAVGDPLETVVNTRTIIDPYLGFKINGKVGPKDTVASIYASDELPAEGGVTADNAQVAIVRYKHALSQDGYLGGFLTGRFVSGYWNGVGGTDGQIRLTPSSAASYHFLLSRTGTGDGVGGHALGLEYDYQTRDAIFSLTVHDLGRDFQTDTGYLTRNGLSRFKAGFIPIIYPKSQFFLRLDPIFHTIQIRDKFSGLWETVNSFDLRAFMPLATTLTVGGRYSTEVYLGQRFGRSAFRAIGTSQVTKKVGLAFTYTYGGKIRYVESPYQGQGSDASFAVTFLPSEKLHFDLSLVYSDFTRKSDGVREYDYTILRSLNVYQVNKYLFFRAIGEYNSFRKRLMTDFLASFTYIPGTVLYAGYGSLYEKTEWRDGAYIDSDRFLETRRGFFFKASYLWRL